LDPNTGKTVKVVQLDIKCPASLSFGGPDMKTMLVTAMGKNMFPGTEGAPNGGVAVVTFSDPAIQGMPINKLRFNF
jgi:sugar lactone lactonase YvrE